MKTVCVFVTKFASLISWVHSCFDRVIFKGHLPISRASVFEKFVDCELQIRRADFLKLIAPVWSEDLVDHSKQFAKKHGRVWHFEKGAIDKDAWAKEQLDGSPIKEGLVGVLCVMEDCPTFKLAYGTERPNF